MAEYNPYEEVKKQLKIAIDHLNYPDKDAVFERLSVPERILEVAPSI